MNKQQPLSLELESEYVIQQIIEHVKDCDHEELGEFMLLLFGGNFRDLEASPFAQAYRKRTGADLECLG